jgi:hypothetical protein
MANGDRKRGPQRGLRGDRRCVVRTGCTRKSGGGSAAGGSPGPRANTLCSDASAARGRSQERPPKAWIAAVHAHSFGCRHPLNIARLALRHTTGSVSGLPATLMSPCDSPVELSPIRVILHSPARTMSRITTRPAVPPDAAARRHRSTPPDRACDRARCARGPRSRQAAAAA